MSITNSLTLPLTTERLALPAITPLFVNRFGRSLRVCNLEFDKEVISDVIYYCRTVIYRQKSLKLGVAISPLFVNRFGRSLK